MFPRPKARAGAAVRPQCHKSIHIGVDGSVIRRGEVLYDITHGRISRVIRFDFDDFGYWFERCDRRFGECPYGKTERSGTIISALRGPVFRAVRRLQRAFREKRYKQWYDEQKGWDNFIDCVVAWVECKGRYFRKSKFSPFSPTPTWGYAPASAIEGAPSWAARDPADVDAEPAGAESDIGVRRRSQAPIIAFTPYRRITPYRRSRSRRRNPFRNSSEAESGAGVAELWNQLPPGLIEALTAANQALTEAQLQNQMPPGEYIYVPYVPQWPQALVWEGGVFLLVQ